MNGHKAFAGITTDDSYEDGDNVGYIATIQEFGESKTPIPPRPFIRPAVIDNRANWQRMFARDARKVLHGEMDPVTPLENVSFMAAKDMRASITGLSTPALEASTIAKRKAAGNSIEGDANPLIVTGLLRSAIKSEVR